MKIEIYADAGGQWRWRVRASNRKITAASGESFAGKHNAIRGAKAFVTSVLKANFAAGIVYRVEEA